jgi:hypothetical protein
MQPEDSLKAGRLVKTGTPGIYKRGSRYVVVFRDLSGRQRKRFAKTLAEARDVKAALTADVKRGEFRTFSRVTFAEYAAEWINQYTGRTRRGIRDETRHDYRRALGLDEDGNPTGGGAVGFFGRMRLTEIEPRDVKRYAVQVAATGAADDTVRLALAPVKTLFATAVEEGLIRSNPTAGVRLPRTARPVDEHHDRRIKALTENELRALDRRGAREVATAHRVPRPYRPSHLGSARPDLGRCRSRQPPHPGEPPSLPGQDRADKERLRPS